MLKKHSSLLIVNDLENYSFGVDSKEYVEILNTDSVEFGGSGFTNDKLKAELEEFKGKKYKLTIKIPALSGVFLKKKSKAVSRLIFFKCSDTLYNKVQI